MHPSNTRVVVLPDTMAGKPLRLNRPGKSDRSQTHANAAPFDEKIWFKI